MEQPQDTLRQYSQPASDFIISTQSLAFQLVAQDFTGTDRRFYEKRFFVNILGHVICSVAS